MLTKKSIVDVNNGDNPDYQQPTPKARTIAAITNLIDHLQKELDSREVIQNTVIPEPILQPRPKREVTASDLDFYPDAVLDVHKPNDVFIEILGCINSITDDHKNNK